MKYVLFVCNHNAGRSQMAQAFFERHGPGRRARGVGRARTPRRADLARGGRGDARGRDRPLDSQAQEASARDATSRRLGDHARLRRRRARTSRRPSRTGTSRPGRQAARRGARDPRLIEAARHGPALNSIDAIRSDRTAAPASGSRKLLRRRSWSSRTCDRPRRSAAAQTRILDATTMFPCARHVLHARPERTARLPPATSTCDVLVAAASGWTAHFHCWRRAAAEAIAAFALVFAGCGAIVTDAPYDARSARSGSPRLRADHHGDGLRDRTPLRRPHQPGGDDRLHARLVTSSPQEAVAYVGAQLAGATAGALALLAVWTDKPAHLGATVPSRREPAAHSSTSWSSRRS